MYWMVGPDGKVYGPYTVEQLRQWLAEGRVASQTQVQLQGTGAWRPLDACPELLPAGAPAGAPPPGPGAAVPLPGVEELRARDFDLRIGACVDRGFALLKANAGLLIAGTLLLLVVATLIRLPSEIGSFMVRFGGHAHPGLRSAGCWLWGVSGLAAAVLAGPLSAGFYWPSLRLLRGQRAEIGDFFVGFRRGFGRLVLVQAVTLAVALLCFAPALLYFRRHGFTFGGGLGSMDPAAIAAGLGLFALGWLAYLYPCIGWMFALPLVVDRRLGAWEAMKLSMRKVGQHWWRVCGLAFTAGLIAGAGVCACCVGLLFSLPLGLAVFACGYEVIFTHGHS